LIVARVGERSLETFRDTLQPRARTPSKIPQLNRHFQVFCFLEMSSMLRTVRI